MTVRRERASCGFAAAADHAHKRTAQPSEWKTIAHDHPSPCRHVSVAGRAPIACGSAFHENPGDGAGGIGVGDGDGAGSIGVGGGMTLGNGEGAGDGDGETGAADAGSSITPVDRGSSPCDSGPAVDGAFSLQASSSRAGR